MAGKKRNFVTSGPHVSDSLAPSQKAPVGRSNPFLASGSAASSVFCQSQGEDGLLNTAAAADFATTVVAAANPVAGFAASVIRFDLEAARRVRGGRVHGKSQRVVQS